MSLLQILRHFLNSFIFLTQRRFNSRLFVGRSMLTPLIYLGGVRLTADLVSPEESQSSGQ